MIDGMRSCLILVTKKRPDPLGEKSKFMREVKTDLHGPDKEDDPPDIKEMRHRLLYLAKKSDELWLFKRTICSTK